MSPEITFSNEFIFMIKSGERIKFRLKEASDRIGKSKSYHTSVNNLIHSNQYLCQLCNFNRVLQVHHLDHNNKNNDIRNLIALCVSCHRIIHHGRGPSLSEANKGHGIKIYSQGKDRVSKEDRILNVLKSEKIWMNSISISKKAKVSQSFISKHMIYLIRDNKVEITNEAYLGKQKVPINRMYRIKGDLHGEIDDW